MKIRFVFSTVVFIISERCLIYFSQTALLPLMCAEDMKGAAGAILLYFLTLNGLYLHLRRTQPKPVVLLHKNATLYLGSPHQDLTRSTLYPDIRGKPLAFSNVKTVITIDFCLAVINQIPKYAFILTQQYNF